uniref:DNA primase/helicase n=1 Tax=Vibrio phage P018-4 TaxID=3229728 RepID=A0AB39AJ85_9CAUD
MSEYQDDGVAIGVHMHCIANEFPKRPDGKARRPCNSSDALMCYEKTKPDGETYYDAVCYSCRQFFHPEEVHKSSVAEQIGADPESGMIKEKKKFENKASKKAKITREEVKELWGRTGGKEGNSAKGYRGLSDWVLKFYGHRVEYDQNGNVKAIYYPETFDNRLMGYKSRHFPKKFGIGNLGKTGVSNQLSGQHKFPDGGYVVVLVGGEEDKCAAQEMFRKYQENKGVDDYNHYAVVSPTTGEPSAAKQCRQQYEWFDSFQNIVVMMDSDEVGREAALEIAEVLPKEKVKIAKLSGKDPNQMLLDKKERQFISDFHKAEEYIKSGIVGSSKLEDAIFEEIGLDKIPLPPFMSQLQEHMAGGIPLGYIVNLIADTGCGKTTIANECVYDWIFNSPYKVGIVSLELDTGQYGLSLLSRHLGKKLQLFVDKQEAIEYLNLPDIVTKRKHLWTNEFGEDRFHLLDDRDGNLQSLKKKIMQMIVQYECKFIIIDPLQDALDGYSNEDQAVFMKWMKQMVKQYKVSFFNVNHVRKEGNNGFDRFLKEADIQGSSAIAKSAGCNIIFTRDKLAEDDVSRNVTKVFIPKCRWTGSTGDGGLWYYSLEQHTLYDLEDYFNKNPEKVPSGMTVRELIDNQKNLHSREKKKDVKPTKNKEPKQEKDFMDGVDL